PYVFRFEESMAKFTGSPYAVATNSGTAALHTALLVGGIAPNDEVIVPDLTFIAPVNAIQYCGAVPVFIDVEPTYYQIDAAKVERFHKNDCRQEGDRLLNKKSGRPVRALIAVHLLGHPCDMDALITLAKKYGLLLIEDAAESLGSTYKGKSVGTLGDIGCFS